MKLKKGLVILAAAMTFTCTAAPFSQPAVEVEAAAVKPKLNKKKVTLTVGKTCKLKVKGGKGKKWKSSKKKVATVSKTGKVTAKKVGKTVISVKVGKKTLKCTVTVKAKKKVQEPVTLETPETKVPETPETKVPETPETKVPETPATDSETFETDAPAKADEVDSTSAKSDLESDYPEVDDFEYTLAIKNGNYKKAFHTFDSWFQDIAGYTMEQEDTYTSVVTLSTKNFSYNPYSLQLKLTDSWYNDFLTVKNVKISKAKNPDGTPDVNNDSDWDPSPTCWKRSYFKHVADEENDEDFSYELPMLEYAGNLKNFKNQIFRFEIKYTIDASKIKKYATLGYHDGKDCYLGWNPFLDIEYRPIADEDYQGSIRYCDNKENHAYVGVYKKVSKLPLAQELLKSSMTIHLADSDSAEFKPEVNEEVGIKRNFYMYPAGTDTISAEITLDTTGYEKAPLEFGLWLDMYGEQYKSVTVYRMKKSSYEAQLADPDAQKKYYPGAEWMTDDNWKTEEYRDPDASFGENRYYNCLMYKGSETSFADHIYKFVITYDTSKFDFRQDDITNKVSYNCKGVDARFRYKQDEDTARASIFIDRNPWERESGALYWGVKVTEN